MSAGTLLKYVYLAYLSRPDADRALYRAIHRLRPKAMVEIGIGRAVRTRRMIDLARVYQPADELRYTGIDLFEARSADAPGLPLKAAHTLLKSLSPKVRLIPGDPYSALTRAANTLLGTDLLIISAGHDPESLARAWFYVPRMIHESSHVFVEEPGPKPGQTLFRLVPREEIEQRAATQQRSTRRAA